MHKRLTLYTAACFLFTPPVMAWDYDEAVTQIPCYPDCSLEEEIYYSEFLSGLQFEDILAQGDAVEEEIKPQMIEEDVPVIMNADDLYRRLARAASDVPQFSKPALKRLVDVYVSNPTLIKNRKYVVLIDFRKPSSLPRMFVFDVAKGTMTSHLTSHGVNTGQIYARSFSNLEGSRQSSLGFFVTGSTYLGANGKSLNLHGLESRNSNAFNRRIVIHKANYVSYDYVRRNGMLGLSWGCPAVANNKHYLVNLLRGGVLLYKYY